MEKIVNWKNPTCEKYMEKWINQTQTNGFKSIFCLYYWVQIQFIFKTKYVCTIFVANNPAINLLLHSDLN